MKKLTISLLALITILSCGATTVSAARFRTYRYHTPRVRRTPRYRIRKSEYSYNHKMHSDHSSYGHHDNMSSYRSSGYSNTGSTATFTGSQTDDILNNQISKKKYRNDYYRQSIITNPWIWAMLINHHARYRHNEEYTRGYNAGFEASQQDKEEGTTAHQTLSSDESAQHTRYYLRGYKEGYRDGINR
ncbi:hypothetical protein [Ligilactobacillus salivarius]|uniref:hypothetical protein n=1 Tax=Ligilactobacillus salivarius TaxID=1624 RepID=UPI0022E0026D|nr:hypothetical protein [Ligilactobacillus salivarius]